MKTLLLSLIVASNLAVQGVAQGTIDVIAAYFGMNDHFADVTPRVRSLVQNNTMNFPVSASSIGIDPWPNVPKVLRVYYRLNGQFTQSEWREGDTAQIGVQNQSVPATGLRGIFGNRTNNNAPLQVIRAVYGAGNQGMDVTGLLQSRIANNRLDFQATNANIGNDPAPNQLKVMQVSYMWQGRAYNADIPEGQWLRLPDAAGVTNQPVTQTVNQPYYPALRIVSAKYGLGNRVADVTNLLTSRIANDRLSLTVDNNSMGGDPGRGDDKQLYVIYEINGQRMEKRVDEGQQITLP